MSEAVDLHTMRPHGNGKSRGMTSSCFCGWQEPGCVDALDALQKLVMHAAQDHGIVARPGMHPFNEKWARARVDQLVGTAVRIEKAMAGSQIVGPDGRGKGDVDLKMETISFYHKASMGIASILDLMLEARSGNPAIREAPKPDAAPPETP